MKSTWIVWMLSCLAAATPAYADSPEVAIGSKKFTESVVLAEILSQLAI